MPWKIKIVLADLDCTDQHGLGWDGMGWDGMRPDRINSYFLLLSIGSSIYPISSKEK